MTCPRSSACWRRTDLEVGHKAGHACARRTCAAMGVSEQHKRNSNNNNTQSLLSRMEERPGELPTLKRLLAAH